MITAKTGRLRVADPAQIPVRLLLELVDEEVGKDHPALGMIRMRQRREALQEESPLADLLGRHLLERLPRHAGGQLDADALLHRPWRRSSVRRPSASPRGVLTPTV